MSDINRYHFAEVRNSPAIDLSAVSTPPSNTQIQSNNFANHEQSSTSQSGVEDYRNKQWLCKFKTCAIRPWMTDGFLAERDIETHREFHRCQWLIMKTDGHMYNCNFNPQDEDELKAHLKEHISNDHIPRTTDSFGALRLFCPMQICSSWSFSVKGTTARGHIHEHILTHACELKSKLGKTSRNTQWKQRQHPYPR